MTRILSSQIRWLRRVGIVISTDIYGVPEKHPSSKQRIIADLRLFWIALANACVLIPQIVYMFLRAADILEVAEVFYPVIVLLGNSVQVLILVIHRKDINRLLAEMQKFVNNNESSNKRNHIFINTEAKLKFYSKIFGRLVFATFVLYVTVPVLIRFQASRTESTISVDPDVGFFKDLYFFNVSKSPMRELCYITMVAGAISIDIVFICITLLFFGMCLYIVALYRELRRKFECIDRKSKLDSMLTHSKSLCECIEFQLAVISFTETVNTVYSHIIFVQYTYNLLGLCCSIFEVFFASGSNVIKVVMVAICLVTSLFIYGWFGQLVLDEEIQLQTSIYGLRWYEYGINEQKMIKLMLQRTQKPCGLAAYNYFVCDLPTFYNIMKNVYTLVTFLMSMY